MSGVVKVERDGPLAVVTFSNPPLNLFDAAMIDGIDTAVRELEVDLPRGLLVRAEGEIVSGGVDVHVFAELDGASAGDLWTRLLSLVARVEALPLPTVFAAHGLTLTAAFELALACDLIVAARSAQFGLVEAVVGITPSMGGTQRLVERAGPARARELVYTGGLFEADTLERWNVVNRVYDDGEFEERSRRFAARLAGGPTRAHAATKQIVRAALDGGVAAADALVPEVAGALFETQDTRRAVTTFLEQGPGHATFEGR